MKADRLRDRNLPKVKSQRDKIWTFLVSDLLCSSIETPLGRDCTIVDGRIVTSRSSIDRNPKDLLSRVGLPVVISEAISANVVLHTTMLTRCVHICTSYHIAPMGDSSPPSPSNRMFMLFLAW